jgi:hypothetical protein
MRGIQRYDPFKMVELVEVSVRTMHSSCVMVLFQMDNAQLLLGFCRFEMKTPFLHSTYVSLFETVSISAAVLISVLQLYYLLPTKNVVFNFLQTTFDRPSY